MGVTAELYEITVKIAEDKVREIKVTREEFDKLREEVKGLSEAQKMTQNIIAELSSKLVILAEKVDALAEAQRRTEESVERLSRAISDLATSVGKLSDSIGFGLEDVSRVMVPGWLERHEKIFVEDLDRRFFDVDGELIKVNLYGEDKDGLRRWRM